MLYIVVRTKNKTKIAREQFLKIDITKKKYATAAIISFKKPNTICTEKTDILCFYLVRL